MQHTRGWRRLLAGLAALTVLACTTTFTETELDENEVKRAAQARSEEKRDVEIGEEGGENMENIADEEEWLDRESDF